MSWFTENVVENPFINQVGGIAKLVQKGNGGDANQRVNKWVISNPPIPGCNGSLIAKCDFPGTSADWEAYRRDWIDGCTAKNSSGIFVSKNKTRASCEAVFDENTYKIREKFAKENVADKNYIKSLVSADNPLLYLLIFLFVGLIVYLLLSK